MNDNERCVGIIREQGEFFDHTPLSDKDRALYEQQQRNEKENSNKENEAE